MKAANSVLRGKFTALNMYGGVRQKYYWEKNPSVRQTELACQSTKWSDNQGFSQVPDLATSENCRNVREMQRAPSVNALEVGYAIDSRSLKYSRQLSTFTFPPPTVTTNVPPSGPREKIHEQRQQPPFRGIRQEQELNLHLAKVLKCRNGWLEQHNQPSLFDPETHHYKCGELRPWFNGQVVVDSELWKGVCTHWVRPFQTTHLWRRNSENMMLLVCWLRGVQLPKRCAVNPKALDLTLRGLVPAWHLAPPTKPIPAQLLVLFPKPASLQPFLSCWWRGQPPRRSGQNTGSSSNLCSITPTATHH